MRVQVDNAKLGSFVQQKSQDVLQVRACGGALACCRPWANCKYAVSLCAPAQAASVLSVCMSLERAASSSRRIAAVRASCVKRGVQLWTKEGGAKGWSRAGSSAGARLHAAAGAAPLFMGMHGEGRHTRLHDFDDHLNDLSKCASPCCHGW